jgi:tetratricopeptide (TPR) repeat protein
MKAERRHELTTNELADWVMHFPEWFKENLAAIIVGAVVVTGLIVYTIFFYSKQGQVLDLKQAQISGLLEQLQWQKQSILRGQAQEGVSNIFLSVAGNLQTAAVETENPLLSALAMIKRAQALRAELYYRPESAKADVQRYQLEQARKTYEQALAKAKDAPEIAAMAEYGIALCLESMGDFTGAEELYKKIADQPEYQGCSFQTRAKFRALTMSDYKKKAFFAQAEPPRLTLEQPSNIQSYGPLKSREPATEKNIAPQTSTSTVESKSKESDINLSQ